MFSAVACMQPSYTLICIQQGFILICRTILIHSHHVLISMADLSLLGVAKVRVSRQLNCMYIGDVLIVHI